MRLLSRQDIRAYEDLARAQGFNDKIMIDFVAAQMAERLSKKISALLSAVELLLCVGPGHNGCDALTMLRFLFVEHKKSLANLRSVHVLLWNSNRGQAGLSEDYLNEVKGQCPKNVQLFFSPFTKHSLDSLGAFQNNFLLLDGFFGSSFESRALDSIKKNALKSLSRLIALKSPQIFSLDIVSGLQVSGEMDKAFLAFKARESWTVLAPHFCQLQKDGVEHSGSIKILKFPPAIVIPEDKKSFRCCSINRSVKDFLHIHSLAAPGLPRSAHKNQRGRILVLGGELRSGGAALLASKAAFHAGAGYVTLLSKGKFPLNEKTLGEWVQTQHPKTLAGWEHILRDHQALIFGCGIRAGGETASELNLFFKSIKSSQLKAIVIDGGGLATWMRAHKAGKLSIAPGTTLIFTPHPKEALDMLRALKGTEPRLKPQDRFELFHLLHSELSKIYKNQFSLLLKGAYPLFGSVSRNFVWNVADKNVATAGMGDVLSGYIGALSLRLAGSEENLGNGVLDLSLWLQRLSLRESLLGFLASEFSLAMRKAMNQKFHEIF